MGNVYDRNSGSRPYYGSIPSYGSTSSYGGRPLSRREIQAREEAEFLRRNEEAKSRPVNAEKASGAGRAEVNMDTEMLRREKGAHTRLTEIYRAASEYLEKGEDIYFDRLKAICDKFQTDPLSNKYSDIAKDYIKSNFKKIFTGKSREDVEKLAKKMLFERELLEIKTIIKMHNQNDQENTVAQYLKDKSPEERWHSVKSMLGFFQKSQDPKHQEAFNAALAPYGYKIVKIENRETPVEVRQVVRAAFDGYLHVPTEEEDKKGIGRSAGYLDFIKNGTKVPPPSKYNFETKLFKALEMSDNTDKLSSHIKEAIRKQRLPQSVVDNLTLGDAAHMLFEQRYPYRKPQKDESIAFQAIEPNCDEGLRNKFWKDFATDKAKVKLLSDQLSKKGVSKEYISFMMESIRENGVPNPTIPEDMHFDGPIPQIDLHHKFYIQDAAFHKDMMKVDDPKNYEIVINYPDQNTHDELLHGVDCISADGKSAYRLVYINDGRRRDAVICDGLETVTVDTKDFNRLTYNHLAQKGERE